MLIRKPNTGVYVSVSVGLGVWNIIMGRPYEGLSMAIFFWVLYGLILLVHWLTLKPKDEQKQ